jgi:hypothetical protein
MKPKRDIYLEEKQAKQLVDEIFLTKEKIYMNNISYSSREWDLEFLDGFKEYVRDNRFVSQKQIDTFIDIYDFVSEALPEKRNGN